MKVKLINLNPVDVVVDVNGKGKVEDKHILHPRSEQYLEIKPSQYKVIAAMKNVNIQVS